MNNLDKFTKSTIGSAGQIHDFAAEISPSGDFVKINDLEVILVSWNNLLLTPTRTYVFDPAYGCDIMKFIFEPCDDDTATAIKDEIKNKLLQYDDRAYIEDIQITFMKNMRGFAVDIYVSYNGQKGTISKIINEKSYFSFNRR